MKKSLYFNKFGITAILFFILSVNSTLAQSTSSFRGMDLLNDSTAWISGSKGTVVYSVDYGKHLTVRSPKGFEKKDFRDISAFNDSTAVVMSAGDSAVILKTSNKGKTWETAYSDFRKGIFLDVLKFNKTNGIGIALGDPLPDSLFSPEIRTFKQRNYFVALITDNYGKTWSPIPNGTWNESSDSFNGMFAASGTSLAPVEFKALPRPSLLQKRTPKPESSKHDFPAINLLELDFFFSGGGKTAVQLRHCHLKINLLTFPKTNRTTAKLSMEKCENYLLPFPKGDGWGCYSMAIHQRQNPSSMPIIPNSKSSKLGFYVPKNIKNTFEIYLAGGHWKFADSITKSLFQLTIAIDSVGKSSLLETNAYPAIYCSGLALSASASAVSITTPRGIKVFKIREFQSKMGNKINLEEFSQFPPTQEKGLNCIRWSNSTLWVVGNKGQVYCKQINIE